MAPELELVEPMGVALRPRAGHARRLLAYASHTLRISWVVSSILARYLWVIFRWSVLELPVSRKRLGAIHRSSAETYHRHAVRLKGGLIKIAQFLSSRVDIMPPEWVEVLGRLQDRVEPAPYEEIAATIREELGAPPEEVFARFDREAVAAASFGQVHRAMLRDGREVAVKVQHRDLERTVAIDLVVLRAAVRFLALLFPKLQLARVYDEVARAVREELKYDRELTNADTVRRNLEGDSRIWVPYTVAALSTKRMLTLEYIDGHKVTDGAAMARAGVDPHDVVEIVIGAYCKQIYVDGFFQSDPHPGNLFFVPPRDGAPLRVGIVDFGQAKHIPAAVHEGLRRAVVSMVSHDVDGFSAALVELGILAPADRHKADPLLAQLAGELRTGSPEELGQLDYSALRRKVWGILREVDAIRIPNDLILYGRVLSLLHGIALQLAPRVNVFSIAAPYLMLFMLRRSHAPAPGA